MKIIAVMMITTITMIKIIMITMKNNDDNSNNNRKQFFGRQTKLEKLLEQRDKSTLASNHFGTMGRNLTS